MRILNLGCGTKTSSHPDVLNIDRSPYLVLKKSHLGARVAPLFLAGQRLQRFKSLPENILPFDLKRKLPFGPDSIDVVYHSHLLEHFDPQDAEKLLCEIRRVLRPGGVHRVVVPDLEQACRAYLGHLRVCEEHPAEAVLHDRFIAALIEQCVRRRACGTSRQRLFRRCLERLLLGDAPRRGETHRWLYDKVSLEVMLTRLGFRNPSRLSYDTSSISGWKLYGLDEGESGGEYRPGSLYMEVQR